MSGEKNTTARAGRVFIGVVMGMATGAVLGVLFAPDKGSTTRKKLLKRGSRYVGVLKDKTGEYVDNLAEKFESVREAATDFTGKAKGAEDSVTRR